MNFLISFKIYIYTSFSFSTNRWNVLNQCLSKTKNLTVKRLLDIRWSARDDACLSLSCNWNKILKALNILMNSSTKKRNTNFETEGLLKNMDNLEMGILISLF